MINQTNFGPSLQAIRNNHPFARQGGELPPVIIKILFKVFSHDVNIIAYIVIEYYRVSTSN